MLAKLYRGFCKVEEFVTGVSFMTIVLLTFMNVILRKFFSAPITQADDLCKLLFSWAAFLGADVALRYSRLVGMDILFTKMPPKVQKVLQIVVYLIMIFAFYIFATSGYTLAMDNWKRDYNTLPISYGWATISLPVGCVLMTITSAIKIAKVAMHFNDDSYNVRKDNPDVVGEENMGAEERAVLEDNT